MSPFRIGFVGTLGALVAYGLAQAIIQARSVLVLLVVAMFIALGLNDGGVLDATEVAARIGGGAGLRRVGRSTWPGAFAVVPVFTEQISNLSHRLPRSCRICSATVRSGLQRPLPSDQ
jgi:hypothetical protein